MGKKSKEIAGAGIDGTIVKLKNHMVESFLRFSTSGILHKI
jgi:bacterioferritin